MCHASVTQKVQQIRNNKSDLDMETAIVPNRKNNLLGQRRSRDAPRGDMQREGNTFPTQTTALPRYPAGQGPKVYPVQLTDF